MSTSIQTNFQREKDQKLFKQAIKLLNKKYPLIFQPRDENPIAFTDENSAWDLKAGIDAILYTKHDVITVGFRCCKMSKYQDRLTLFRNITVRTETDKGNRAETELPKERRSFAARPSLSIMIITHPKDEYIVGIIAVPEIERRSFLAMLDVSRLEADIKNGYTKIEKINGGKFISVFIEDMFAVMGKFDVYEWNDSVAYGKCEVYDGHGELLKYIKKADAGVKNTEELVFESLE